MKIIGIDFGSKRVGVAVADTEAGIAFPKAVLPNDKFLLGELKNITKGARCIVFGESRDLQGKENSIFAEADNFKKLLERETGIDVFYEPEFYTTYGASRIQGDHDKIDASAAAIILQSYLDKNKK